MQLNITKVLSHLNEKSDKDQTFLEKFNSLFYGEQRTNEVNWEDFMCQSIYCMMVLPKNCRSLILVF